MKRLAIFTAMLFVLAVWGVSSRSAEEVGAVNQEPAGITLKTPKTVGGAVDWARSNGLEPRQLITSIPDTVGNDEPLTIFWDIEPNTIPVQGNQVQATYITDVVAELQGLATDLTASGPNYPDSASSQIDEVNRARTSIQNGNTSVTALQVNGTAQALAAAKTNPSVSSVSVKSEVLAQINAQTNPAPDPPDLTLTSNPEPVPAHQEVALRWDNPDNVQASCSDNLGNSGSAQDIWNLVEDVTADFVWTVHCWNPSGEDTDSITVHGTSGPPPPSPPPNEWEFMEQPINCSLGNHPRYGDAETAQYGSDRRAIFQEFMWTSPRARRLNDCFNDALRQTTSAWEQEGQFQDPHQWLGAYRSPAISNLPDGYKDTNAFNNGYHAWTVGSADGRLIRPMYRYFTRVNTHNGPYSDYFNGQVGLDRETRYFASWPGCNHWAWCVSSPGQTVYPPEPLRNYDWHEPGTEEIWWR